MRFKPSYFHLFNLDTVAAALVLASVFLVLPDGKTPINLPILIALGCAVFSICTIQDLINCRLKEHSERNKFVKANQRIYHRALALAAVGLAIAMWYLPKQLYAPGIMLALLTGIHLAGIHFLPSENLLKSWKELGAAILLTTGIWICHWWQIEESNSSILCLGAMLFGVILQNTLLCSHLDIIKFKKKNNLARTLGKLVTTRAVLILTVLVVGMAGYVCWHTEFRYVQRLSILFAVMSLLQGWIFERNKQLIARPHFRMIMNLIYLIPILAR